MNLWKISVLLYAIAISAHAGDEDKSLAAQYAAWEKAQECVALKSVLRKAKAQLENLEVLSANTREILAKREKQLSQCGKQGDGARDLAAVAERCPTEYLDYMAPGVTQAAFQEDLKETARSVQTLSNLLQSRCHVSPDSANF